MANEVLLPTSTTAADANLTGNHTAVDDDPDSPGGDWRGASSNNSNSASAHGFNTPTGNPTTGAGKQNFKVYARLTANATSCTYNVYVSESGTRLNGGAAIATGSLTSTTGQLITTTWDATLLGTADGSLVECEFVVTKSGGGPSSRTTGEVDAIEWNVDYTIAVTNYTADLNAGSYTVTGNSLDVAVLQNYVVDLAAGSYVVTGNSLGIVALQNHTIDLNAGSYTSTGNSLGVVVNYPVELASGSYIVTGNTLGIVALQNYTIDLASGSYTKSGNSLDVLLDTPIGLGAGSYTTTGNDLDVNVLTNYTVDLAAGGYTLTGNGLGVSVVGVSQGTLIDFLPSVTLSPSGGLRVYYNNIWHST